VLDCLTACAARPRDHRLRRAKHLVYRRWVEIGREEPAPGADLHGPAGRPIEVRHGLDHARRVRQRQLVATSRARQPEAKQPRLDQRRHDLRGEFRLTLRRLGVRPHGGGDPLDIRQHFADSP
jgi:hypothetical protein